jgi:PadR family transcriptional regulator
MYINYSTSMRTYLGEFEQLLLLALLHLREDAYGARIREEIQARTGRLVSPGAVYTALDRLERRELVSSRLGDPTAQRGGKRKRYYRLQPAGATLLRESHNALRRMALGVKPRLDTP